MTYQGFRYLLIFALCLLAAASAWAQGTTSLRGTVTDPAGAVVPNTNITLTNVATAAVRVTHGDALGNYLFVSLAPGTYRLKVEATGFKGHVREDIELLVNVPATLNVALELGTMTETVTVTAEGSTINTTDASVGFAISNYQVTALPMNARNTASLYSLQPGVTPQGYVNGSRADQSNVTLDGVDVNDQQAGQAFFSVLRLTPDALQEFRVVTSNANADMGRSSGAQVALVTKSGTNTWHGSLYEYHRNTRTTANHWFNNRAGVPREKLLRNNFGGSVGGPVKRDRAFLFFNYEGFRQASSSSTVQEVPLSTLGQGIVRYKTADGASDNTCPSGTPSGVRCLTPAQIDQLYVAANGVSPGLNPAALATLAGAASRYPANDATLGDGLNTAGFRFNAPNPVRQNTYIAKLDLNLSSSQTAFLRANYEWDNSITTPAFPDTPQPGVWRHPTGLAAGHTWTLGATRVNTFRYGFTREAFTTLGDSADNNINFRFIYTPRLFSRSVSRLTPVHNWVDDFTWTKGQHQFQFGVNFRWITNSRLSFGRSYDAASINPTMYESSGQSVTEKQGVSIFPNVLPGFRGDLRDALTAVIGRFSQYTANLNYDAKGALLQPGVGVDRIFKTQEYETYFQDTWRLHPSLTLTYGLRWSTSTPVYEANGTQVKPFPSLSQIFDQRVEGANIGQPYNGLVKVDLAGKVNNRPGFYDQDWNNFGPVFSAAWSPSFQDGILGKIFGARKTVIRGGYRAIYDRLGGQLAVNFDLNSSLGFASQSSINANTFNVSDRLAPRYTGPTQNLRDLGRLTVNPKLTFPLQEPDDEDQRIQTSLDDRLYTPVNHSLTFSLGREIGQNYLVEFNYVGRMARNLLLQRDVMHLNNLVDPKSGMNWYSAMGQLIDLRYADTPIASVAPIAYFENMFPKYKAGGRTPTQQIYRLITKSSLGGFNETDWTYIQAILDDGRGYGDNLFFHPQYAALNTWSTLGESDYHSAQFSFRKQHGDNLTFALNYTFGHSIDNASGLQAAGNYDGSAFIYNPLDLRENRSHSDFDIRHVVNANWIWSLPFGRGKALLRDIHPALNHILGGWQVSGIYRWNSGLPAGQPFDNGRWATNWQLSSRGVAMRPVESSPTRTGSPNLFSDPTSVYRSYRNARPGEGGDRNRLRLPSYVVLDLGVGKTFSITESKRLVFRWETFNLTNTQRFRAVASFRLAQDPFLGGSPASDFGRFTDIQGSPRVMQFALRFEF